MTKEGLEAANLRAESFEKGFKAGVKAATAKLIEEHSKQKKQHSFFYAASEIVKGLL